MLVARLVALVATSQSRQTRASSPSTTSGSAKRCRAQTHKQWQPGAFGAFRPTKLKTHCARLVQVKEQYLACLKENASQAEGCRELAKTYLECRMERCLATFHASK